MTLEAWCEQPTQILTISPSQWKTQWWLHQQAQFNQPASAWSKAEWNIWGKFAPNHLVHVITENFSSFSTIKIHSDSRVPAESRHISNRFTTTQRSNRLSHQCLSLSQTEKLQQDFNTDVQSFTGMGPKSTSPGCGRTWNILLFTAVAAQTRHRVLQQLTWVYWTLHLTQEKSLLNARPCWWL